MGSSNGLTLPQPQLAQQLIDKAIESGTKVQMGAKVVNVDLKNSTLELADGAKVSADLIIAADGVHVSTLNLDGEPADTV